MSTHVAVKTYTHSVTYLSEKLVHSIKEVLRETGLSPARLAGNWESTQRAISKWLGTQDLLTVHVEIFNPTTDKLTLRWDFDINYDDYGDGSMWVDTDDLRYRIRKTGQAPRSCDYRIILMTRHGRPDVEGWSSCDFRSTAGMSRHAIGVMANAGSGLGASAAYWSK